MASSARAGEKRGHPALCQLRISGVTMIIADASPCHQVHRFGRNKSIGNAPSSASALTPMPAATPALKPQRPTKRTTGSP
jgi:hypothetical protein